jgi:hypothetical protein
VDARCSGQDPLRKIIRKTLGDEVMASQALKRVVEDGGIAAGFQAGAQFT